MKKDIFDFLAARPFCVISTVTDDSKPEAAFVGFSQSEELEIIIGTSRLSRKYKNLQTNPHVALVVADTEGEVQYEGVLKEIAIDEYQELVDQGRFIALPSIDKYRNDPSQVFLLITPTWIRFILHGENPSSNEMTEF